MIRRPPRPTLFPSTPLFRSRRAPPAPDRRPPPAARRQPIPAPHPHHPGQHVSHPVLAGIAALGGVVAGQPPAPDRKSTRPNSSHAPISYSVFCLKKTKNIIR